MPSGYKLLDSLGKRILTMSGLRRISGSACNDCSCAPPNYVQARLCTSTGEPGTPVDKWFQCDGIFDGLQAFQTDFGIKRPPWYFTDDPPGADTYVLPIDATMTTLPGSMAADYIEAEGCPEIPPSECTGCYYCRPATWGQTMRVVVAGVTLCPGTVNEKDPYDPDAAPTQSFALSGDPNGTYDLSLYRLERCWWEGEIPSGEVSATQYAGPNGTGGTAWTSNGPWRIRLQLSPHYSGAIRAKMVIIGPLDVIAKYLLFVGQYFINPASLPVDCRKFVFNNLAQTKQCGDPAGELHTVGSIIAGKNGVIRCTPICAEPPTCDSDCGDTMCHYVVVADFVGGSPDPTFDFYLNPGTCIWETSGGSTVLHNGTNWVMTILATDTSGTSPATNSVYTAPHADCPPTSAGGWTYDSGTVIASTFGIGYDTVGCP